jgi:predicted lipoprotein with Yx(FWY)xxD motif
VGGQTVLTNAKGFTLYSFAPDTPTTSKCNGTCAQNWPPVQGPAIAHGLTGPFGPGQDKGNGLNAFGGL